MDEKLLEVAKGYYASKKIIESKDVDKATEDEVRLHMICTYLIKILIDPNYIFKIGSDFGSILYKAKLDVPLDPIVDYSKQNLGLAYCIELPDNLVSRIDTGAFDGYIQTCYMTAVADDEDINLLFDCPIYNEDGSIQFHLHEANSTVIPVTMQFRSLLKRGQNLSEVIDEFVKNSGTDITLDFQLIRFFFNAFLYINSGDPDLRYLRAPIKPSYKNDKKSRQWLKKNEENSLIDYVSVGFDFRKDRIYTNDESFIPSHLRWQPYGPMHSKRKLIFVKPHVRKNKTS